MSPIQHLLLSSHTRPHRCPNFTSVDLIHLSIQNRLPLISDTKARRKKDPNRLSCICRNAFWGVAQSCWSQFLGRGYLVSMKEKSVRDIRKMIRPNPAACTAISLWELTFCSGEKGGEFTVAPPPKKNPKDGFNQIHRIGIVNISTRGRVIFGNAGAAVVPSLACKSTSCWPQDF